MKPLSFLIHFGYNQALACLFPVAIFLTLALSKIIPLSILPRYDFILILCLLMQVFMVTAKFETWDELKVICLFHVIGLALELYKVHMGSWSYPEEGFSKLWGVPLYSGFMYASVASYMCQSWRRLHLTLVNWPPTIIAAITAAAIYLNFFTHHFIIDLRWILIGVVLLVFYRTIVTFTVNNQPYQMPVVLSFVLMGFFIWVAENVATFFGAWQYPNQEDGWHLVHFSKISSWLLLVIVSFLIVALLKHVKQIESRKQSINLSK
ncbi:DUF817 domain-containing protein [Peribacillus psychrosaccharolyticus]|uniref:DUF817 domain-containing protein n=1 Tax=Peribacillus psychrosaccharolyticus TaxID=1407 RepID=UPI003D282574